MLKDEADVDPNDQDSVLEHLDKIVSSYIFYYIIDIVQLLEKLSVMVCLLVSLAWQCCYGHVVQFFFILLTGFR